MITSAGQVGGSSGIGPDTKQARIRAQAARLEGVFMQELLKAMRETVPKEGVLEGGQGEDIFSSMFDEHIAEVAARRSGGALTEALVQQLAGSNDGSAQTQPTKSGPSAPAVAPTIPDMPDPVPAVLTGRIREP